MYEGQENTHACFSWPSYGSGLVFEHLRQSASTSPRRVGIHMATDAPSIDEGAGEEMKEIFL